MAPLRAVMLALASASVACTSLVDSDRRFGRTSGSPVVSSDAGTDAAPPDGALLYEEVAFLKSDAPERLGAFGFPVVLSGEEALVGSAGASITRFVRAGRGYVLEPTSHDTWEKITGFSSLRPEGDGGVPDVILPTLGIRPPGISMTISGDTLVLGVAAEDVEHEGALLEDAGAVYVLERTQGTFKVVQRLTAATPHARDGFGIVTAIDGDTLAVAAPWDDGPSTTDGKSGADDCGAVLVFRRTGGLFGEPQLLRADVLGGGDLFGASLALEGDVLVVGDPAERGSGSGNSSDPHMRGTLYAGAVYTFSRDPKTGAWNSSQYLKPEGAGQSGFFGMSVALEGSTLVVGAPTIARPGSVHVFERTAGAFAESGPALTPRVSVSAQLFGFSIALSADTLVIGAPGDTGTARGVGGDPAVVNPAVTASGAAHVFRRVGRTWRHAQYLKASNADSGDLFGLSVAVSGSLVGVGAPGEASRGPLGNAHPEDNSMLWAGAAYLFRAISP